MLASSGIPTIECFSFARNGSRQRMKMVGDKGFPCLTPANNRKGSDDLSLIRMFPMWPLVWPYRS